MNSTSTATPAKQLAGFIAKFDPKVAANIRVCRSAMRKLLPTANELVYDNYQFLAIGYCPNERTSDCIVSLACGRKGVSLCFTYGAHLPNPDGVLTGGGNQVRFVRLDGPATLKKKAVTAALKAAIAFCDEPLPKSGKGRLIIRAISAKQQPRR